MRRDPATNTLFPADAGPAAGRYSAAPCIRASRLPPPSCSPCRRCCGPAMRCRPRWCASWCRRSRSTSCAGRWPSSLLLPFALAVLRPGSPMWPHWRRYAVLGLLGVGCYNALQYLALQTSTPINVTLVGASMPLWMLAIGALFFGAQRHAARRGGRAAVDGRRAAGAQPRRLAAAAGAAAGARRSLHAAGDRRLGVLQLAAGRAPANPRRCGTTGPPS